MTSLANLWREFDRQEAFAAGSLRPLLRQIDQIFNEALVPTTVSSTAALPDRSFGFMPNCEVDESDNHYLLSFDVPGVAKDDLSIELHSGHLVLTGERKSERTTNGQNGQTGQQRRYGKFQRVIALPEGVKAEDVEADYRDGVLKVIVAKPAAAKAAKIKIGENKPGFLKSLIGERKAKDVGEANAEPAAMTN